MAGCTADEKPPSYSTRIYTTNDTIRMMMMIIYTIKTGFLVLLPDLRHWPTRQLNAIQMGWLDHKE